MENTVILIVLLITCVHPLTASIEDAIVATGTSTSKLFNRQLNIIYGSPYDMPTEKDEKINYKYFPLQNTLLLSSDVDYRNDVLYFYDHTTASIYAVHFHGRNNFTDLTLKSFHRGLSRGFVRLAVDWISHNVYWTDPYFQWIAMQPGNQEIADQRNFKILVSDHLKKPTGLAVDPIHGLMFWSDIGGNDNGLTKIERATLTGDDRQTIVSTGLLTPMGMDVDIAESRLYWVDDDRDTIQSADFTGNNKMIIRRLSHSVFIDIAIFGSIVTAVEYRTKRLNFFNKVNGKTVRLGVSLFDTTLYSVALYSTDTQPLRDNNCDPSPCSDICVSLTTGPKCLCREGYQLHEDGVTCSEKEGQFARAFVIATDSSICLTDVRVVTTVAHWDNTTTCVFNKTDGGDEITALDLDMTERKIIFSTKNNIYTMDMRNYIPTRNISTKQQVTGLALDWLDKNIYYSMGSSTGTGTGTIKVVSQQTSNSEYAVVENLYFPRSLALQPLERLIVWISGTGINHSIKRSNMDGTDITTIVSSGRLISPVALTVDILANRILWTDTGFVRSSKLDGTDYKTIEIGADIFLPKQLLMYKGFLVLTEDVTDGSYIVSVRHNKVKMANRGHIKGIRVLDPVLQPEQYGPCDVQNGECEHICLPVGRNRLCQCNYGFHLDDNKLTCSSVPLTDNFLYVTDWTHGNIYQVSLLNGSDVRGLDINLVQSPNGVAYNTRTKQVVIGDTTESNVHVVNTDGSDHMIISKIGTSMAHPDRFAIDNTSGNIFYTAVGKNGSASWVGVISPIGLHRKLIVYVGQPRDIVLEPSKGFLFWTDHAAASPFVKRANMDGTSAVAIVTSKIKWPNGLAIDYKAELLYLSDGWFDTIQRCTYTGQCSQMYQDYNGQLMDIDLLGDFLYYTAWNRHYITRLNKSDVTFVEHIAVNADLGRLDSLALYSSSASPQPVSPVCTPNNGRGPCSTFCLPTSGIMGYTCACEDGIGLQADGKTCTNVKTTATTTASTTPSTTASTTSTDAPSTSSQPTTPLASTIAPAAITDDKILPITIGGSAGAVVLIGIIVVIVVCVLQRRSRRGKDSGNNQLVEERPGTRDSGPIQVGRPDTVYDLIKLDDYNNTGAVDKQDTQRRPYNEYERLDLSSSGRVASTDSGFKSPAPSAPTSQAHVPNPSETQSPFFTVMNNQPFNEYISPVTGNTNTFNDYISPSGGGFYH